MQSSYHPLQLSRLSRFKSILFLGFALILFPWASYGNDSLCVRFLQFEAAPSTGVFANTNATPEHFRVWAKRRFNNNLGYEAANHTTIPEYFGLAIAGTDTTGYTHSVESTGRIEQLVSRLNFNRNMGLYFSAVTIYPDRYSYNLVQFSSAQSMALNTLERETLALAKLAVSSKMPLLHFGFDLNKEESKTDSPSASTPLSYVRIEPAINIEPAVNDDTILRLLRNNSGDILEWSHLMRKHIVEKFRNKYQYVDIFFETIPSDAGLERVQITIWAQ
jgi:hypothetical protein